MTIHKHLMPGTSLGALVLGLSGALMPLASTQAAEAVDYSDVSNWLCRPSNSRACEVDMSTTIVKADGSIGLEPWSDNPFAPVDCFYVYPTVSQDATANSDMVAGPEEYDVVRSQFTRMGSQCRAFAPLYRQVTLTALRANMTGDSDLVPDRELGYQDVLNAWNYYLENDNEGRGVVLIGHSQGAGVLTRLIVNEIEGKDVEDQIVSAMLLGTTIQVPEDAVVGGTFKHMPLCERGDQTGCIITYASYRATNPPPPMALFGRNGNGTVSACTNPAQLAKGSNELDAYLSNVAPEGFSSVGPTPWTSSYGTNISTPFVSVPGLLSAECVSNDQFSYLEITVNANPDDPRTDTISGDVLNPDGSINEGWGLHLIDVNATMGDLIELVSRQAHAYQWR
ncbi:DUF3089 domain-containing protein [Pseudohongiella sp.]|uniref:Lysophospholipase n=1 Tax=marine sediment metagenome TaxID=412755 RepID=A0A0F9Z0C1_9ZZZZ|nr:DUF3089 domain-containing protein [Pseudohongiella sp.]